MRKAIALAFLGFAWMFGGIFYGFAAGDGWNEVRKIWVLPWGKVTFIDVYTGFILFSCWLVHRERKATPSILWIVMIMAWGNLATTLYVAIALIQSKGNWNKFWMGNALTARV